MVTTPVMTTSGAVQIKAGANVDTATMSGANICQFINEAESLVCATTTYNWMDAYSGLNTDVKNLLNTAVSAKAAMMVIQYDPDSIGRNTALLRLNVLRDEYDLAIRELKDKDTQRFVRDA